MTLGSRSHAIRFHPLPSLGRPGPAPSLERGAPLA